MVNPAAARTPGLSRRASLDRRTSLLLKLVMLILPPLVILGGLDLVARLWENQQAQGPYAWELVASRRIEMEVHSLYGAPGAGYTLMKPGKRYQYQGIPVEINAQGLRGPALSVEKPAGVTRILNLGDSIAMGWAVRFEQTYGQRLTSALESPAGRPVEVINAGVPGWNLENELAYLQVEGVKFAPDLVILEITIANDIWGTSALVSDRPALFEFLRAHTYFWPFLTIQVRQVEARARGKERIAVLDPPHTPSAYFPENPNHPRWNQLAAVVKAVQAELEKRGVPLLVVLFPLEDQVIDPAFSTLPQQALGRRLEEAGIPTVDLLPAFQQACAAKPGGTCVLEDRYLFADVWMHPSPLGHQVAAQQIAAAVQALWAR